MSKLWLLIAMVFSGVLFSVVLLYFIPMPISNKVLLHCILMGALFGIANFIVVVSYYRRHEKLTTLNQQMKSSLMTDSLTGLLNRRAFDQAIQDVEDRGLYSLIFLDIDNFGDFNNRFGHDIGDNVLRMVSETIKACVRASDRVYRYGGEEITIILMDCDKENALRMAEKIRLKICKLDHQAYPPITVSLGVSTYPDDGRYIHEIVVASDKALLKAKQSGKNCTIATGS